MVKKKESSNSGSSNQMVKDLKRNNWAVVSVILGIVLVVSLFTGGFSSSSSKISAKDAGQKIVDFAAKQGATAEVVSVEDKGSLYLVTVKIQGQDVPVYVTADGQNLVPSVVALNSTASTTTNSNTQTPAPTNLPKSDKPKVELFVMSHCPYGTQMEKAMLPAVAALGDKIDFSIKFVYYAMHGEKEVYEELNQYCMINEQKDKYLSYLQCFLGTSGTAQESATCRKTVGIDEAKLSTCAAAADTKFDITKNFKDQSSWLSGQFPLINFYKEDNSKYNVGGSPTLIINGVEAQVGRSPSAALAAMCGAFNTAPSECKTSLPTAQASPGFGYGTSAADSAAVQCGV